MADVTFQVFDSNDGLYDILSCDGRVSIGTPIQNMRIDIVEPNEYGIGELVVTGPGVTSGYHNANITSCSEFIFDKQGQLHFRTGDLGKIWNNRIYLYGRNDTQIKIAGNRVDLTEVEFILKQHCNCRQPIAIYLADMSQVVVFLQQNEKPIDLDRETLSKHLPLYAIPTQFVTVPEFPLLVSGKIDRRELINSFKMAQRIIQHKENMKQKSTLDEAFFDVLDEFGISPNDADQNFFNAGGSSLIAISLVAKLHRVGFHHLAVERLMSATTLRDIILYRTDDNHSNFDVFFEGNHNYSVVPLKQIDKDEALRIITESFVKLADIDVLVHHNCEDLKLQYKQDWLTLLNQRWPYHVASGLSFSITVNNGCLVGIALSNDLSQEPPMDFTDVSRLTPIFDMIETGENELLEDLRVHNNLPERVLSNFLAAVNPDLHPEERLKAMYYLEREILIIATSKQFQAVITANANSATKQLAEHVFKYDMSRIVYASQYRDSSRALVFPHAEESHAITINMKYVI